MINIDKLNRVLKKVDKPARYIGMEQNSVKKDLDKIKVKFAFSYPDIYEVGMSHLGMHILYNLINSVDNYACERVFSPWVDMEIEMRKEELPLYTLENKEEVKNFDFLGFTLQYEMSYTNILNLLDLSHIPLLAKDRNEDYPFIVGGGPCAYNPEPIADFFDFFVIGEGEEILLKVLKTYEAHKDGHWDRNNFLKEIAQFHGIYVPAFYRVDYNENGTINNMYPLVEGVPTVINKAMVEDVNTMFAPETMIVPFIETIHDRVILEMFRGCTHGCRFCQAGMIYRPIREKSTERLVELAEKLIASTGYDTISLSSLSSCDYSSLNILISDLMDRFEGDNIGISLPSLRLDSFSIDILKEIEKVKKSGLTFAPEAGSQRLRDVINKGVNQEDLVQAVTYAFNEGWSRVKLYFMVGLPTETEEDLMGIKDMSYLVRDIYFNRPNESKKGSFGVTVSTGCFVPKPFTPFQWVSQNSIEEFNHKISLVKTSIRDRKVNFNYSDVNLSYLEGIFARGDRRLSNVLIKAWEKGCKYDGWSDQFRFDLWMEALEESNIDGDFYSRRARELDEVLPWDFINPGVSKEFLKKEYLKSLKAATTMDCRLACGNCGIIDCSMRGVFN